jgi:uncharacterized membrane protein YqjE
MAASAALMAWYDWKLFSLMVLLAPIIWVVNENYRQEMAGGCARCRNPGAACPPRWPNR